ncbi:MAG: LPS export ABC transporter periplasmic protein LptC [Megasphaera sp.]|jgi:lipopolysaccharide export system protein LptA|nr:LPS export ABC transporter periplasmic protein LptC [Megasphaera sp.]MCH4187047.1 LPS export ABC transporter periplasmic protein LptC [Megasphaera sp.]MCH4217017.1 LPS export ABC transporter periplasmic protein LptC [Megasphaera sp.]
MTGQLRNKWIGAALLGFLIFPAVGLMAADGGTNSQSAQPAVSVTADKLEYNGKTQVATATGNVVIVRDKATMTGNKAVYNLKSAEADMEGNVVVEQPDMHLDANKVHSTNRNYIIATGSVHGINGDKKVNGDQVEYYLDQDYSIVTGNGYLEAQGSQLWADHIDAWFKQIKAVGTGNVHIESPADHLTAYAGKAVYTQTPNVSDGVIHLTGDVYATQNGNSLTGNDVQIRLADNSVQSMNRSTVVIVPGSE